MNEVHLSPSELRTLALSVDADCCSRLYEMSRDVTYAHALLDALDELKASNPRVVEIWSSALAEMHPGIAKR